MCLPVCPRNCVLQPYTRVCVHLSLWAGGLSVWSFTFSFPSVEKFASSVHMQVHTGVLEMVHSFLCRSAGVRGPIVRVICVRACAFALACLPIMKRWCARARILLCVCVTLFSVSACFYVTVCAALRSTASPRRCTRTWIVLF